MKNVLITGGAGMIGSNLCRRLQDLGYKVKVVDNLWRGRVENLVNLGCSLDYPDDIIIKDLTIPNVIDEFLSEINYVYHLADIVAGIGYVFGNQRLVMRQNLIINSNVFDSVSRVGKHLKGLIYVGTACSYPKQLQLGPNSKPLLESDIYPAHPESSYGWSKLIGQIEAELLCSEINIPLSIPILHNVYGTPCDLRNGRSQVIPSLCKRISECHSGDNLEVWGSGEQGRAFVHVDDVVDALILCMERGLNHGHIQIGPSICTPIKAVVTDLIEISGKKIIPVYDRSKPEGDGGRCASGEKARSILGWEPKISLRAGLESTYTWVNRRVTA